MRCIREPRSHRSPRASGLAMRALPTQRSRRIVQRHRRQMDPARTRQGAARAMPMATSRSPADPRRRAAYGRRRPRLHGQRPGLAARRVRPATGDEQARRPRPRRPAHCRSSSEGVATRERPGPFARARPVVGGPAHAGYLEPSGSPSMNRWPSGDRSPNSRIPQGSSLGALRTSASAAMALRWNSSTSSTRRYAT